MISLKFLDRFLQIEFYKNYKKKSYKLNVKPKKNFYLMVFRKNIIQKKNNCFKKKLRYKFKKQKNDK